MNNYEFCANFVAARAVRRPVQVLDYGCGNGKIVTLLRERGLEAFGCDVFYEGGDYSNDVPAGLFGTVIRRMEGDLIPFPDNSFDWIISNQVFEHVPNLEVALTEMRRVLKPDGLVLSMFPDRGVWREGHCGIPFLHWFPRESRFRVWYATVFRAFGFGLHTEGRRPLEWSENFCRWLDSWTYYRSYSAIRAAFLKRFSRIEHFEDEWLRERLGSRAAIANALPRQLQRLVVRKMIGLVFVSGPPGVKSSSSVSDV